jgi:hypothetical protein
MLRFLSIAALASAAIIAASTNSPVSAAAVTINVPTGTRVNAAANATSARQITPHNSENGMQNLSQGPKQRRWVCGPIVNYDGSPHCHWAP